MQKLTFAALAAIAVAALSLAVMPALTNQAFAKIEPVCENPGGQEPQGNCRGERLTEENRNPAGKAPEGHNK